MRCIVLAGLIALATFGGAAVAEPLPIDSSKLEYGPARFQLMLNGEPKGEMYYALEQRDGDIVLHEATTMLPDIRESATAVMDGETFAPKSITLDGDFSRMIFDTTLNVKDGKISGEYIRKQPSALAKTTHPFSADLPDDVIFRPAIFGVVPGLPLNVGARWALQWFSPLAASLQDVTLEVTGIETVDSAAGRFETYTVYITAPQSNIAYVTTEAPHRVVRIDVIGQEMYFDRLPGDSQ